MFVLGSVVAKFKFGDLKIGGREKIYEFMQIHK